MSADDEYYERHLPHQIPTGVPLFVTFNLKGAIPQEVWSKLLRERDRLEREPIRPNETPTDRRVRHSKMVFAMTDHYLDAGQAGPLHLKDDRAAKIVEDSILFGIPVRYRLFAYCLLPNHWHLVLWPREDGDLSRFMGWLTLTHTQRWHAHHRTTRTGHLDPRRFKSFPIQEDDHFLTVCRYVERNALRANLCSRAEEWAWSSLYDGNARMSCRPRGANRQATRPGNHPETARPTTETKQRFLTPFLSAPNECENGLRRQ